MHFDELLMMRQQCTESLDLLSCLCTQTCSTTEGLSCTSTWNMEFDFHAAEPLLKKQVLSLQAVSATLTELGWLHDRVATFDHKMAFLIAAIKQQLGASDLLTNKGSSCSHCT